MWVRRAAIRPVPPYAVVPEHVVTRVEDELAADDASTEERLDEAFARFERAQPVLSTRVDEALGARRDETAAALGWFLALTVWLSFERAFGDAVGAVDAVALDGVEQSLRLDEEIRLADPAEVVDSEDVVSMEQPHLVRFVHEHVDAALEAHADDVDVDDVHAIYRVILIEVLALSYAVAAPSGAGSSGEASA